MIWNNLELPPAYYQDDAVYIIHGDCREANLQDISAIVTDPPYELGFMGKSWDSKGVSFQQETWEKLRSFCKSGAPLLSFGGTRTFHRIACAIEDAGFELRDVIMWVYGQGFPKSLDISKAIDKQFGAEREVGIPYIAPDGKERHNTKSGVGYNTEMITGFKTDRTKTIAITTEAQLWEGYGTALKPAYEPIILAMNPLNGTFANNALKEGVAGLNIDGCRVDYQSDSDKASAIPQGRITTKDGHSGVGAVVGGTNNFEIDRDKWEAQMKGRFPANFIHDGSQSVMELFPDTSVGWGRSTKGQANGEGSMFKQGGVNPNRYDMGGQSAARFFYCAKASRSERDNGLEELPMDSNMRVKAPRDNEDDKTSAKYHNNHPTVKPLALMEYLVKLVKMPQYNLVLDPFCGSGTTLLACINLRIPCIGIDSDEKFCEIAAKRCSQSVMRLEV